MKRIFQGIGIAIMGIFVMGLARVPSHLVINEDVPAIADEHRMNSEYDKGDLALTRELKSICNEIRCKRINNEAEARKSGAEIIDKHLPMKIDELTRWDSVHSRESDKKMFNSYTLLTTIDKIDLDVFIPAIEKQLTQIACTPKIRKQFVLWDSVEYDYKDLNGKLVIGFVMTDEMCK